MNAAAGKAGPPLCIHCRHYNTGDCVHPDSPRDVVRGWPTTAAFMRQAKNSNDGPCGVEGRLFEPASQHVEV
jgi:hypothetical protein